jgi:hypothetical protein
MGQDLRVEGQYFVWQVLVLFFFSDISKKSQAIPIPLTTVNQYFTEQ